MRKKYIVDYARVVMNFIPSTFNEELPSYTAVGGRSRRSSAGLSAVILYRGNRSSRFSLFEELANAGFDYVISMEKTAAGGDSERRHYDIERLTESYPFVRFIFFKDEISRGGQINIAAAELNSPLFFVLWNDVKIIRQDCAGIIVSELLDYKSGTEEKNKQNRVIRLCSVPVIHNRRFETIPTMASPVKFKKKFSVLQAVSVKDADNSLFPYDGIGIYDRERFIRIGGFDSSIKNFYWQLLDFGLRSFLWGEEIAFIQKIRLAYDREEPEDDSTADHDYRRFFLKNLAPVYRGDFSNIPLRRFPGYLLHSHRSLFAAWKEYSEARRWTEVNSRNFKTDAGLLLDSWVYPK